MARGFHGVSGPDKRLRGWNKRQVADQLAQRQEVKERLKERVARLTVATDKSPKILKGMQLHG